MIIILKKKSLDKENRDQLGSTVSLTRCRIQVVYATNYWTVPIIGTSTEERKSGQLSDKSIARFQVS